MLFIGTQFSNLYTTVDTPARGRVQMWYEVIRTTSLYTQGQHQRRVVWAFGKWYSRKPLL